MNKKQRFLIALFLLAFVYLLIFQVQAIWPFTIDDMFITLRYADHWAQGYGVLWNIGEAPVEGYSNFSFLMLAVIALKIGFNPVIVLKLTGVFCLFLTTYILYLLSRLWFSLPLALIPCIWMLSYCGQIWWAVSGLETTLYQALLGLAVYCLLRALGFNPLPNSRTSCQSNYGMVSGLLFAVAGLTRPEAPILAVVFFILAYLNKPKNESLNFWCTMGSASLVFLAFYVPYFLWRWHYFGQLFANPVYCKGIGQSTFLKLDKQYLALAWPFIFLALITQFKAVDKRYYFLWAPSLVYALLLFNADDIVTFGNRLFLPAFIILLPLALLGIEKLLLRFCPLQDVFYRQLTIIIAALGIGLIFIPTMSLADFKYFARNPQIGEQLRRQVVSWLDQHLPENSQVVLADCGIIPYLSKAYFIDSYCLNNKTMAADSSLDKYNHFCKAILQEKPQAIILTSLIEKDKVIYTPADQCLAKKLRENKIYNLQVVYQARENQSYYRYEIFTLFK